MMSFGKGGYFFLNTKQPGDEIVHPWSDLNQQRSFLLAIQAIGMGASVVQPDAKPFFSFTHKLKKCLIEFNEPFAAVKIRKSHSESKRGGSHIGCRRRVGSQF